MRSREQAWSRHHGSGLAFAVTGAVAALVSWAVFAALVHRGGEPLHATAARLAVALPILYLGYSRWMLRAALHLDRTRFGHARAELRMLGRVVAAVAISTLGKMLVEPVLTAWLMSSGHGLAVLAPVLGDCLYGPALSYAALCLMQPRTADRAVRACAPATGSGLRPGARYGFSASDRVARSGGSDTR